MPEVYDPIRDRYLSARPEEIVRQKILQKMLGELHYPKALTCIEGGIVQFKALSTLKLRRFDILCFHKEEKKERAKHLGNLAPLLLIECKAHGLTNRALNQLLSYNEEIGAKAIALADDRQICSFIHPHDEKKAKTLNFLPSYEELLKIYS